jgi:group I intron endonuclease
MELKDFAPIAGVYKIINTNNEKVYFGQSNHIMRRICDHTWALANGKHTNKELLRDFQLHGFSIFIIEIIEICEKENLFDRELYHLCCHNGEVYNHKTPHYYAIRRRLSKNE